MGAQPLALVGDDEAGQLAAMPPGDVTPRGRLGRSRRARLFERVRVCLVAAAWNFQPAPRTVFRPPARRALAPRRCFSSTLSFVNPPATTRRIESIRNAHGNQQSPSGPTRQNLESHTGSAGMCRVPESLERLLLTGTQQRARVLERVDRSQPTPAQLPGEHGLRSGG